VKQYCYVVVMTNGFSCWTRVVARGTEAMGQRDWEENNLGRLLQEGWRPVRETPMSDTGSYACSLIVLEKDGTATPA
jgi:hypothetical protein